MKQSHQEARGKIYILNATLINPHLITNRVNVSVENGRILEINFATVRPEKGTIQIDATDLYLCPGFIDLHFHGAKGKDTMDGNLLSLQILSNYCAEHGVTSFYPTTWAALPKDILLAINNDLTAKTN